MSPTTDFTSHAEPLLHSQGQGCLRWTGHAPTCAVPYAHYHCWLDACGDWLPPLTRSYLRHTPPHTHTTPPMGLPHTAFLPHTPLCTFYTAFTAGLQDSTSPNYQFLRFLLLHHTMPCRTWPIRVYTAPQTRITCCARAWQTCRRALRAGAGPQPALPSCLPTTCLLLFSVLRHGCWYAGFVTCCLFLQICCTHAHPMPPHAHSRRNAAAANSPTTSTPGTKLLRVWIILPAQVLPTCCTYSVAHLLSPTLIICRHNAAPFHWEGGFCPQGLPTTTLPRRVCLPICHMTSCAAHPTHLHTYHTMGLYTALPAPTPRTCSALDRRWDLFLPPPLHYTTHTHYTTHHTPTPHATPSPTPPPFPTRPQVRGTPFLERKNSPIPSLPPFSRPPPAPPVVPSPTLIVKEHSWARF